MVHARGDGVRVTAPRLPVFVYGTLRTGGPQAHLLGAARRVPATCRGALWALPAGYPALAVPGSTEVRGELVGGVPAALLDLLDVYEGVPEGLYTRRVVPITVAGGDVDAWAWVMDHPEARGGRPLPSGEWRPFLRR